MCIFERRVSLGLKIVIVGGVAGGASAAARLRRLDEYAEIIMFERGEYISYANCGLPYYIGGIIQERDKLFVETPESFSKRFNLDVRVLSEVTDIDRKTKEVVVKNLNSGDIYRESYDYLILSPGAEPVRPPIEGVDLPGIFTIRTVPDTDKIKNFIENNNPMRAVIVGAGFIGLEMAENLHDRGMFVTIIEMADQVMTPLDYEMAAAVHQHLKRKHVEFYLQDAVTSFERDGEMLVCNMKSGRVIKTDMVILSVGVRPENKLVKMAGLETGQSGGISVNEYLQTSDPNIYAVGDAIEFKSPISNVPRIAYLAGPTSKQGRIAANNIIRDKKQKYSGTIATAIAKVFDLTVASTGFSEKALNDAGIDHYSSVIHASSHAGYYPGAQPLTLKIMFDKKSGRIYGAQAIGYTGIDKRIDLIAATMKQGGTVYDLADIEHAYAPPYSSAKDPVNLAGMVGINIIEGLVKTAHWNDIVDADLSNTVLLDVRTAMERITDTIEGSLHIPLDELRNRMGDLPKEKKIIVFCAAGLRGYLACRILQQHGFKNVYNLSGGFRTYSHVTQKQSNEDIYEKLFIAKDNYLYSRKPGKS